MIKVISAQPKDDNTLAIELEATEGGHEFALYSMVHRACEQTAIDHGFDPCGRTHVFPPVRHGIKSYRQTIVLYGD